MFNEHPELAQEFPEHKETIHRLKTDDAHFAGLMDQYHTITRELLRVAQEIETVSDPVAEDLKKKRLALKDELFAMVQKAA